MATNMRGKKVQTHQDDEVRYIFTPTKHSYNNNLKNILLWTSFKGEERTWVNRVGLVGLRLNGRLPITTLWLNFLTTQNWISNIIKSKSWLDKSKEL